MKTLHRTIAVLGLFLLCACGGGGGAAAVPSAQGLANGSAGSTSWLAVLREEPSAVALSLAQPQLPRYIYVDSGAANGVYPSPATFAAEFEAANPGLLTGPCARIAHMSGSVMEFTDAHGVQAPSYVIFFTPVATGSCAQSIALGAEGTRSFTVAVSP